MEKALFTSSRSPIKNPLQSLSAIAIAVMVLLIDLFFLSFTELFLNNINPGSIFILLLLAPILLGMNYIVFLGIRSRKNSKISLFPNQLVIKCKGKGQVKVPFSKLNRITLLEVPRKYGCTFWASFDFEGKNEVCSIDRSEKKHLLSAMKKLGFKQTEKSWLFGKRVFEFK